MQVVVSGASLDPSVESYIAGGVTSESLSEGLASFSSMRGHLGVLFGLGLDLSLQLLDALARRVQILTYALY